jgi:UDP-2,3-diacylglucosamine hydrolase
MNNETNKICLFVGDTHFHLIPDDKEEAKVLRFLDFLEMSKRVDELVLLGDIFDFWFDYPHFRLKGYDSILEKLDEVYASGTDIRFIGGNHDIWASSYFHQRYNTPASAEPQNIKLDNTVIKLIHGDGLLGNDFLYSGFRKIVRTKLGILLAKSMHPELLYHFSKCLSGSSRQASRDEIPEIESKAEKKLASIDGLWDILLMGHIHHPMIIQHNNRKLISLGSWIDQESYGLWKEGQLSLHDFADGPDPV